MPIIYTVNFQKGLIVFMNHDYVLFSGVYRFPASLSNDGKFTCTATNEHGTAKIETQVDYYSKFPQILQFYCKEKILCFMLPFPDNGILFTFFFRFFYTNWLIGTCLGRPFFEISVFFPYML